MFGANPDGPVAIFQQRSDAVVDQPILTGEVVKAGLVQMADAVIGADPQAAVSGFEKDADKVVHQPLAGGEVLVPCGER